MAAYFQHLKQPDNASSPPEPAPAPPKSIWVVGTSTIMFGSYLAVVQLAACSLQFLCEDMHPKTVHDGIFCLLKRNLQTSNLGLRIKLRHDTIL